MHLFYSLYPSWHLGRLNPRHSLSFQGKDSTKVCRFPCRTSAFQSWWQGGDLKFSLPDNMAACTGSLLGDSTYPLEVEWHLICFPLKLSSDRMKTAILCYLSSANWSNAEMKSSVSHCKCLITLQGLTCFLLVSNVTNVQGETKKKIVGTVPF